MRIRDIRLAEVKMYSLDDSEADRPRWFAPSAKRFFGSRVCRATALSVGTGVAFVTSEARRGERRYYSVRFHTPGGAETVGEFCGYRSRRAALQALRDYFSVRAI